MISVEVVVNMKFWNEKLNHDIIIMCVLKGFLTPQPPPQKN